MFKDESGFKKLSFHGIPPSIHLYPKRVSDAAALYCWALSPLNLYTLLSHRVRHLVAGPLLSYSCDAFWIFAPTSAVRLHWISHECGIGHGREMVSEHHERLKDIMKDCANQQTYLSGSNRFMCFKWTFSLKTSPLPVSVLQLHTSELNFFSYSCSPGATLQLLLYMNLRPVSH